MFHRGHLEFYGGLNLMKGAIIDSDAVTTVSPTYAREILTPALGQQLDGVLREQGPKLRGILNGLDLDSWDPSTDPALPAAYSAGDLAGKARCRQALLAEFGLEPRPDRPVGPQVPGALPGADAHRGAPGVGTPRANLVVHARTPSGIRAARRLQPPR